MDGEEKSSSAKAARIWFSEAMLSGDKSRRSSAQLLGASKLRVGCEARRKSWAGLRRAGVLWADLNEGVEGSCSGRDGGSGAVNVLESLAGVKE